MNFTPSRSKVSPPSPKHCRSRIVPCPSLSCTSLAPSATAGAPGPCTQGTTGIQLHLRRGSRGRLHSTFPCPTPALLQHIPTFYLKSKATHGLPDSPLFLWGALPYTLLPMMNTVYCVRFKEVLFNCSLLPVLVTHLPHACF